MEEREVECSLEEEERLSYWGQRTLWLISIAH